MLNLPKDCCNYFLLSLLKKHLNEHAIYYSFSFLIEKVSETYQLYYRILFMLLNSFLFLSRFSVSLKNLNHFFRRFAHKSFLNRLPVLISHIMWSSNHFSISRCFSRFSGSRFFQVQVFQGLGSSGSRFFGVEFFQGPDFSV